MNVEVTILLPSGYGGINKSRIKEEEGDLSLELTYNM